jgi:hypothetical protein
MRRGLTAAERKWLKEQPKRKIKKIPPHVKSYRGKSTVRKVAKSGWVFGCPLRKDVRCFYLRECFNCDRYVGWNTDMELTCSDNPIRKKPPHYTCGDPQHAGD